MTLAQILAEGFDRSTALQGKQVYIECSRCNACVFNGFPSHESGCPNACAATQEED
jgi:hypothetical protein